MDIPVAEYLPKNHTSKHLHKLFRVRHWDELLGVTAASGTRMLAIGDPAQLGAVGPVACSRTWFTIRTYPQPSWRRRGGGTPSGNSRRR